jgi:leader peptidase (prepilin peptidase) / N-methyltransferase
LDFLYVLGLAYYFAFASLLIVIFVYDLKHKLIPDFAIAGILALFGFRILAVTAFRIWNFEFLNLFRISDFGFRIFVFDILAAVATLIFFGGLWYFSKGKAMGFGDVKLAPALVLFLGASKGVLAILLSFWIGAIVGIILMLGKKAGWKSEIPFGPFLTLGAFIALLWGEQLIQFYFGIF